MTTDPLQDVQELMSKLDKLSDDYDGTVTAITESLEAARRAGYADGERAIESLRWLIERGRELGYFIGMDHGLAYCLICNEHTRGKYGVQHTEDCQYAKALEIIRALPVSGDGGTKP